MRTSHSYLLLGLVSFIFIGCADGMSAKDSSRSTVEGIIGGDRVDENSELSRSVVMIRTKLTTIQKNKSVSVSYSICTGSIVAPNVILTAAHCIVGTAKDIEIAYTTDLEDDMARVSAVESVKIHELYKGENDFDLATGYIDDDIALIKIKGEVPSDYKIMQLAEFGSGAENFEIVSIGYGRSTGVLTLSADTNLGAGVLRAASIQGMSYVPNFNFFLSNQKSGKGVCYGDSGGPALVLIEGEFKILGITKAVFTRSSDQMVIKKNQKVEIDNCKFNGLFMNLQFYQNWIYKSIDSLNGLDATAV